MDASITLAVTDATREAERLVRDPGQFKWYAVFLLVAVVYVYSSEVEARRWPVVAAGLAVWLADWINEMLNSVVLEVSDTAPLWAETGPTAYQFLVGLNFETSMMFALAGLAYAKLLPSDRRRRILGIPNRVAIALVLSLVAVAVEVALNDMGYLRWHYWWWDFPFVPLIVVFGYLWFFLAAARAHDLPTDRERFGFVGGLAATAAVLAVAGGPLLGWL